MPTGSAITDQALVKFTSDPNGAAEGDASTVWLVDAATQQLRPFMSEDAFNNHFRSNAQAAWSSIRTLPITELGSTGSLANFKTLDHTAGIQSNGEILQPDLSAKNLTSYYGNSDSISDQDKMKQGAIDILKAIKMNMDNLLTKGVLKGFTRASLDAVFLDHASLAKMISAVAFGNYDGPDITKEAMRLAMVKEGRTELKDKPIISDTQNKGAYLQTTAYKIASTMPALAIPGEVAEKLMAAVTRPEYFQEGVYTDLKSMKGELDKIGATLFDLIEQGNNATTERGHQVAQTNYDNFREQMDKTYGIKLSKNAIDAWGQLMSYQKTAVGAGLAGSGLMNEEVDQYLKQVRSADSVSRMEKLNTGEKEEMAFYTSTASPDQIAALIAKDQASGLPKDQWKSVKFGLLPDASLVSQFDVETIFRKLKQDQPEVADWELRLKAQATRDQILDKNGNFLSTLYGNKMKDQVQNTLNKTAYQQINVLDQEKNANAKIFDQYTDFGITDPATAFKQGKMPDVPAYTEPVKTEADKAAEAKQNAAYQESIKTQQQTPVEIPKTASAATVIIQDNNGNKMTVSQDAWRDTYSKQSGRYSLSSQGATSPSTVTQPVTVPKTLLSDPSSATSTQNNPYAYTLKSGLTLSDAQKSSIANLAKKKTPWSTYAGVQNNTYSDLANWNYATGQNLKSQPTI